ncbi:MarR family winged helix-turn-helix transcriptional regulator [Streptomyces sp. MP131-18]|uniref:MarR family winged helix-turn-helix transcriptional regulator n=1 Tax=Streptomyces sp. MP131-18 TaxID=1857892 RepID=UPI00097C73E0|nr:MarR family winged helix-turn-helix transcriptional regulator [Streptomyces sp. MP131-18]ONK11826.1 CRISPR locus-related DNA-binding protein [Streptomyces sp. MP131-18]
MTPESTTDHLPDVTVLDALQHEVALFARRAEQTRLGGLGAARDSMDRAAYLLLSRLDQDGPAGVKALAARLGIDSSTVTRQVAPLVDAGLVHRTADPADGRAVVLALSPPGADRLAEVRSSRRRLIAVLTADWTGEERAAFRTLLTRFNASVTRLQAAGAETGPETGPGSGT